MFGFIRIAWKVAKDAVNSAWSRICKFFCRTSTETVPSKTTEQVEGNQILAQSEGILKSMHFAGILEAYLSAPNSMLAFSETCKAARDITAEDREKHALKSLWDAVTGGNEDLVRKIVTSYPALLLDSSAIVKDISGKEIKERTPLQAAICAGDVDMVQAIKEVLHQKLQRGINLSFEPKLELQRQFKLVYPNGVDSEETEQQVKAQEFKTSTLNRIFTAINTATVVQVRFELDTPGMRNPNSPLNEALHKFRDQFAVTSNLEQIFNPFYLLNAFALYNEQFDNFNGNEDDKWDKRDLFWRQVIGYIQRHLPACYLQAFAQGIYNIVEDREKLRRDFEFRHDKGFYMRVVAGDLNNLGYEYAAPGVFSRRIGRRLGEGGPGWGRRAGVALFQKLLRTKKSGLENLVTRRVAGNYSYLSTRCVIA